MRAIQVFLETERLLLRQFTPDDVDNLVALDGDPEVMRYINGGRPTPRAEIEHDYLPAFLRYYERFSGRLRHRPGAGARFPARPQIRGVCPRSCRVSSCP